MKKHETSVISNGKKCSSESTEMLFLLYRKGKEFYKKERVCPDLWVKVILNSDSGIGFLCLRQEKKEEEEKNRGKRKESQWAVEQKIKSIERLNHFHCRMYVKNRETGDEREGYKRERIKRKRIKRKKEEHEEEQNLVLKPTSFILVLQIFLHLIRKALDLKICTLTAVPPSLPSLSFTLREKIGE